VIRIALGIEYEGTNYHGWQRQPELPSVQSTLEKAISIVADQEINIFCAGRTDSGVHATGQVVHFDYTNIQTRDLNAWTMGVNCFLPNDISVKWAKIVPLDFHARFSATSRRYQYYIYINKHNRALLNNRALWVYRELDIAKMQLACQDLLGEQDFSCFKSSECQSASPMRNVIKADMIKINNFIVFDITANAFLHHMIRNIISCLIEIGLNKRSVNWLCDLIKSKDRKKAAKTAAPHGLYLVDVKYDAKFNLIDNLVLPFNA